MLFWIGYNLFCIAISTYSVNGTPVVLLCCSYDHIASRGIMGVCVPAAFQFLFKKCLSSHTSRKNIEIQVRSVPISSCCFTYYFITVFSLVFFEFRIFQKRSAHWLHFSVSFSTNPMKFLSSWSATWNSCSVLQF